MQVRDATVVQEVSVPCGALPFRTPLTYQLSAVLVVPLRVAANTCLPLSARLALVGPRVTTMASVTVTLAVLYFGGVRRACHLNDRRIGTGDIGRRRRVSSRPGSHGRAGSQRALRGVAV